MEPRAGGFGGLALLVAIAVAGAGRAADPPPPSADPAIVALVPPSLRAVGTLEMGTDATYPPFESIDPDTGRIVGFDVDLGEAIADLMGLKPHFVNMPFDTIIPALDSGKLDVAMSSIGDTREREAVVDFVTYYWNSTDLLVPAANPRHLATDKLCGATIGVERGSLQQTAILPLLTRSCGSGPEPARSSVFQTNTEAALALSSGRLDAVLNDAVANAYVASHSAGQFAAVGPALRNASPGGVAIRKGSGLRAAVLSAVKTLMADGAYGATVRKWALSAIAIDDPTINWAGQR